MERKSWAQPANPGSPGKMATEYVALDAIHNSDVVRDRRS